MEQHAEKKPFGKREWVFLIVVLILSQLIVHMLAWRFGASVSALGYISFAGMIVSIILAVLAIIYGFVQTGEQSRASSTIASQVTSLHRVVESFQKSGGVLSEQLQQLSSISAGIGQTVALGEKSQEQIGKVQASLDDVKNLVSGGAGALRKSGDAETSPSTPAAAHPLKHNEVMNAYVRKMKVIPFTIVFGIAVANKKGETVMATIRQKYFVDIYKQEIAPTDKKFPDLLAKYLEGYFIGVVRAVPSAYLAQDETTVTVVNEFAIALRNLVETTKLTDEWGKVLNRLKELDRQAAPTGTPAAPETTAT